MQQACEKVEEWGNAFILLVLSLMLLWLVLGVWVTAPAGRIVAGLYVLAAVMLLSIKVLQAETSSSLA